MRNISLDALCLVRRTCVSTNRKTSERQLFCFSQFNTVVLLHHSYGDCQIETTLRSSLESGGTLPGRTAIRPKVRGNPIGIRNRYLKPGAQGAEKKVGAVSTPEVRSYFRKLLRSMRPNHKPRRGGWSMSGWRNCRKHTVDPKREWSKASAIDRVVSTSGLGGKQSLWVLRFIGFTSDNRLYCKTINLPARITADCATLGGVVKPSAPRTNRKQILTATWALCGVNNCN